MPNNKKSPSIQKNKNKNKKNIATDFTKGKERNTIQI